MIDGTRVKLSHFYVPGILTMSIVVAAYANLVVDRGDARERRAQASPRNPRPARC
jgi:hypothetical protein